MSADESVLRERFPWIPWDQPIRRTVFRAGGKLERVYVCRYCVSEGDVTFASREEALSHIEREHHD